MRIWHALGVQILIFAVNEVYNTMIYTYLDADKLRYAARELRFAYNLTMARVIAFHLSCVIEAMPCFCPQVNVRIWTPYYIKENYS